MDLLHIPVRPEHEGLAPDAFLALFSMARSKIARIRTEGLLVVNGVVADFHKGLSPSDDVVLDIAPFEGLDFLPEEGTLPILYEDGEVLVVDKPSGIIVHPDGRDGVGTLVNRIAARFRDEGLDRKVGYLHRLDRDTTGTLLVAKDVLTHAFLSSRWDHERISRSYLALASGRFRETEGVIDLPLGRDRHVAGRRRVSASGESATTRFRVLDQFRDFALVRLDLVTGRTHQIRVHLSHIGHPLLGDALYGGPAAGIERCALHAQSIVFPHPMTGETIHVEAPLPPDFMRLLG
jgi:23S rRNA pseudouridine1911/1915/1917 synthase